MAATLTFWALLTRAAVGLFALQVILERELLGKLFFRVNTWIAAVLLILGLAFRLPAVLPEVASDGLPSPWSLGALMGPALYFGCLVLLLGYLLALRRARPLWIDRIQRVFVPFGVASLAVDSLFYPLALPQGGLFLIPLSAITSAFLLGAVLLTMMLGHWYLVIANLSIRLLARSTVALVLAMILRSLSLAATLILAPTPAGQPGVFVGGLAVFMTIRVLFGLVGPLCISVLIWKTVKMRSTQAATGLLYVVVAFVLVGELVASYLLYVDGVAA